MKILITFLLLIIISSYAFSQYEKNSVTIEGITLTFGMSENEFSGIYPNIEKSGDVYEYYDSDSNDNSSLRYEFKFLNDKLVEFAVYTHWPNEAHLEIFEKIVSQYKITETEEDEMSTTKYLKKDDIKGYALYGENATLELWDTRYIKKSFY